MEASRYTRGGIWITILFPNLPAARHELVGESNHRTAGSGFNFNSDYFIKEIANHERHV